VEGEVVARAGATEAAGSLTCQRALDDSGKRLPNSPACLVKFRAGRSLTRALFASVALQDAGERLTGERNIVAGFTTLDATLTAAIHPSFDVVFGARNLSGSRYRDPAGYGQIMDTLEQDGRSLFVRLIWRSQE
jgi:hypothetical protein